MPSRSWHRKHAVRALAHVAISSEVRRQRRPTYGAAIRDALVALWEASDRICGKRLQVMIPTLLPLLKRHGKNARGVPDAEGERSPRHQGWGEDDLAWMMIMPRIIMMTNSNTSSKG
jgi:hypothetical protein